VNGDIEMKTDENAGFYINYLRLQFTLFFTILYSSFQCSKFTFG